MLANIIRNAKKTGIGGGGGGIVTGGDPYYSAVSLLLPMDGTNGSTTFTDSGPNAIAVTAVGNAQISTTQSKYGGASAYFDGSGDYLTFPTSTALQFGSGDFTVEMWVYKTSNKAYMAFAGNLSTGTNATMWQIISDSTGNKITWFSSGFVITGATTLNVNTWYHVAVSRNGTNLRLFINGILDGSATNSHNYSSTNQVYVAQVPELLSARDFAGYLDDLRITRYARYTSAFTPPTQAHPNIYNPYTTLPVSGAALWLDASQQDTIFTDAGTTPVTTSGQSIYQWNDLSGNNRHAVQATSGNRPTWVPPASGQNGLGAVRCSTSLETRIVYSSVSSSDKTIFIVHKGVASSLTDTRLFTVNADYKVSIGSTSTTLSFVRELIAWTNSGFSKVYNPTLFNLTYTNTPTFSAVLSKSETSGSTAIQTIASTGGGSGYPDYLSQSGDYYEVVLFTRTLTTTEISAMNNYLRSKWGTP